MELFPSTSKKPKQPVPKSWRLQGDQTTTACTKRTAPLSANAMFKESIDCIGCCVLTSYPQHLLRHLILRHESAWKDDAEAKAKLGEMLTEYLTLMDYLDQEHCESRLQKLGIGR